MHETRTLPGDKGCLPIVVSFLAVIGDAINPRGGRIAIPQGAGLGVDPDPAALQRLALDA